MPLPHPHYWMGGTFGDKGTVVSWTGSLDRELFVHDLQIEERCHVQRVVCQFALGLRQPARAPLYLLGAPLLWRATLTHVSPPHPGQSYYKRTPIQSQVGPLTCHVSPIWEGGLQNWAEGAGSTPGPGDWRQDVTIASITTWSGGMEQMNQDRSDGTIGAYHGNMHYELLVDLIGGSPTPATSWDIEIPDWLLTGHLRALVQYP